jgi:DNA helicase-2/ATP-dependent DNA helicase PcrA
LRFIADFHIHSHFSVATSNNLTPEYLDYWARLKGIDVVGTGDCVHPGWLTELKEKLEPVGNGLFRLKSGYRLQESLRLSAGNMPREVFFILTGEISTIYTKNSRVRKVHNICVFPDFDAAEKVQMRLEKIGNIRSDGRPILGLDSKFLLEFVLESSGLSYLIPAHIWTPWFSVLGSKSGFDSIEECFEDLTPHIFALETGLSSDPPMNRTCSFIDRYALVSNSDAHSPEKLGREANLFDAELSFGSIRNALKTREGFSGTIEFFPEEGKYHYDGHRKCGVRWDPLETVRHNGICDVCGKPVTKGVMYRVAELADRAASDGPIDLTMFHSITQLPEILAEILNQKNSRSGKVMKEYYRLTGSIGSEFYILLDAPLDELRQKGGELLAEGIRRLRNSEVVIEEGYDGEFGRIRVFALEDSGSYLGDTLFGQTAAPAAVRSDRGSSIKFDVGEFRRLLGEAKKAFPGNQAMLPALITETITEDQRAGIEHVNGPCMVIAGPGTGKTRILTQRIIRLVKEMDVPQRNILALTFSNKAAMEMKTRLQGHVSLDELAVSTFHSFGLSVLKEHYAECGRGKDFYIVEEDDMQDIVSGLLGGGKKVEVALREIEACKQGIQQVKNYGSLFERYNSILKDMNAVDLGDLVYLPAVLFREKPEILEKYQKRFQWILVDEFQDINQAQYDLLMLLAGSGSSNLFIIGDPDQAIYGFRGSDTVFMKKIGEEYPGIKVMHLGRSFRCPDTVIRVAGQILGAKSAITGKRLDMKVNIQMMETDRSEADWIARTIEAFMGGVRSFSMDSGITDGNAAEEDVGFSDIAVLCRASFMFDPLIEAFQNHAIPYQVVGSEPRFRQGPYRSAVRSLKKIYYGGSSPDVSAEVAGDVREMIEKGDPVADVLKFIMLVSETGDEAVARITSYADQFGNDYREFLRALAMRQGYDDRDERASAVSIMTLHASKGLEFNTVFIPGCERGIIPFELYGKKNESELAEEERLLYVGVTRTVKNLYLTYAKRRAVRGRVLTQERSPLLDRLEEAILIKGKREQGKSKKVNYQLDLFK